MGDIDARHEDQKQFDLFAEDYDRRFIQNYPAAYGIVQRNLEGAAQSLVSPLRILDVACGTGWAAKFLSGLTCGTYVGIDPSGPSLKILSERMKKQKNIVVTTLHHFAERILEQDTRRAIRDVLKGPPNLVICNAAFHQIAKTYPSIDCIICQLSDLLSGGGMALLGDYYYPDALSEERRDHSMRWIKETTGQNPTPPENWLSPRSVREWIDHSGLTISAFQEERANQFIYLNYYMFVCQKRPDPPTA